MGRLTFNELVLLGVVGYMALDERGALPPHWRLAALRARFQPALVQQLQLQLQQLLQPHVQRLLPLLSDPRALGALAVLALAYALATRRTVQLVAVPELATAPVGARRVRSTALQAPDRPGLIQCYSPSTLQFLGEVAVTPPEGVRDAVARARALQPAWGATSFEERRRVLRMMTAAILRYEEEIVRISCIDTGKPRVDAQFGEVLSSCGKLQWVVEQGEAALRPEARATNMTSLHKAARVEYHPLGVVGVIAPWNYPFYNLMNHIAAALMAGNAVVLKISEYAAWSGSKYIALPRAVLAAAGYSPDLVQLVQGFGETGAALVSAVDKLVFTGSPGVGKHVMRGAAAVRAGAAPERPGVRRPVVTSMSSI